MTDPAPLRAHDATQTPMNDWQRGTVAAAYFDFPRDGGIEVALAHVEAAIIERALNLNGGVKRRAAIHLGISRYALERRLVRIKGLLGQESMGGSA